MPLFTELNPSSPSPTYDTLASAVVRFAGDSGDGMQLVGTQFTDTSAILGNDVATLPDYPAEIRAPRRHGRRGVGVPDQLRRPADLHAR